LLDGALALVLVFVFYDFMLVHINLPLQQEYCIYICAINIFLTNALHTLCTITVQLTVWSTAEKGKDLLSL
jgi:NADH:ubiquinone oxidoreductase subunit H